MSSKQAFNILREPSPTISVGILSADLMNLSSQLALLEGAGIRAIHFDAGADMITLHLESSR